MRRLVLLLLVLPAFACAAPDRADLIHAWETAMRGAGALDAQPDGTYRYRSEAIGYDGNVKIVSAIVRPNEDDTGEQADVAATGSVDFDLVDLPERSGDSPSTGLMMWKVERQNFVYDAATQAWQTSTDWAKARYSRSAHGSAITGWLANHLSTVVFVAFLAFVFWWLSRVQRQTKSQMSDASDVNRMARENVERAAQLQEQQRAMMAESLELARRSTAALESILAELRRKPSA